MKCTCGESAVYHRRYSGQIFCKTCFNTYFEKKVYDTIREKNMVRREDKVGVALSGGKDSTVLLYVLDKLSDRLDVKLHAVTVDEGIEGYREKGIMTAAKTCKNIGIALHKVCFKQEIHHTLDKMVEKGDLKPCTYCGVFRRTLLNKVAKRLELDSLAVGHNLDDEAQVVLMNYLTGDLERLHRLNGNAENDDLIKRIKPLSRLPEKEIMLYALLNNLHISTDQCPYAGENFRNDVRDFLNRLEETRPGIKFSVISGWEKLIKSHTEESAHIEKCGICESPSARNTCRACELSEEIKIKMSEVSNTAAD